MVASVEGQTMGLLRARNIEVGGWKLFVGRMPPEPDKVIIIMKGSGRAGEVALLVDYPGIQILLRGGRGSNAYEEAEGKLREVRDHLLGIDSKPVEFPTLISCTERGSSVPLGHDESERPMFSTNFQLIVEPAPSAHTHRVPL
jgi:hypothetical protein